MTIPLRIALIGTMFISTSALPSQAGVVSRACLKSDRQAKSVSLCRCIQDVADHTLSSRDQKLAASFFKDPHRAQEIRQSDRNTHEEFWQRYKAFGQVVAASCASRG